MGSKKSKKYAAELAKIKEFKILDSILKKGDVENALLSNTSKESEPVSETVIDSMLESVERGKGGERDMELIEKLTTNERKRPRGGRKAKHAAAVRKAEKARKRVVRPQRKKPKAKKRRR
jgi:hypothetical protein